MNKFVKFFILICTALISAAAVHANPFTIEDMNIQEKNNDYIVIVTASNGNASNGEFTEFTFTIEELGTSKTVNAVKIENSSVTETFTYNLQDLTDNFNLLTRGNTYTLTVEASNGVNTMTETFLFGSEKDTEGLDIIIEKIEVDGTEVTDIDSFQVLNGEVVDVTVRFTALQDVSDARLRLSIDGYEHGVLDDSTEIFDAKEGVSYIKRMSIVLPHDMDSEKRYVLRLYGANGLSGITYKELSLYVDTQRDRVDIIDLIMTPSSGVEPGQNVIANVRMKNRGQQEQDTIRVTVAVPELGISESSYVSNLNKDQVVTSDDMLLFVPEEAKAGSYEAVVTLRYDDGYDATTESFTFNVLSPRVVEEKNLLVSFNDNIDLRAGKSTEFDIVVGNPNSESKPISIVPVENTWADVEVLPTLAFVQAGSDATFTVKITPKDAVEGEKSLTLLVKEGTNVVSEFNVSTYVEGDDGLNLTNIILAVLLIIAIIILLALVVAIARRKDEREDEEEVSTEEYY